MSALRTCVNETAGRGRRYPTLRRRLAVDVHGVADVDPVVDVATERDRVPHATMARVVGGHGVVPVRRVAADEVDREVHALGVVSRLLHVEVEVASNRRRAVGAGGDVEGGDWLVVV